MQTPRSGSSTIPVQNDPEGQPAPVSGSQRTLQEPVTTPKHREPGGQSSAVSVVRSRSQSPATNPAVPTEKAPAHARIAQELGLAGAVTGPVHVAGRVEAPVAGVTATAVGDADRPAVGANGHRIGTAGAAGVLADRARHPLELIAVTEQGTAAVGVARAILKLFERRRSRCNHHRRRRWPQSCRRSHPCSSSRRSKPRRARKFRAGSWCSRARCNPSRPAQGPDLEVVAHREAIGLAHQQQADVSGNAGVAQVHPLCHGAADRRGASSKAA